MVHWVAVRTAIVPLILYSLVVWSFTAAPQFSKELSRPNLQVWPHACTYSRKSTRASAKQPRVFGLNTSGNRVLEAEVVWLTSSENTVHNPYRLLYLSLPMFLRCCSPWGGFCTPPADEPEHSFSTHFRTHRHIWHDTTPSTSCASLIKMNVSLPA